jgi:hypothetical protein
VDPVLRSPAESGRGLWTGDPLMGDVEKDGKANCSSMGIKFMPPLVGEMGD